MSELYINKVLELRTAFKQPGPYWKSISAEQRRTASTHCGPDESYPLGPGCAHVSAAFKLALSGHGKPSLSCIRNYARKHGCSMPPSQKAILWIESGRMELNPW